MCNWKHNYMENEMDWKSEIDWKSEDFWKSENFWFRIVPIKNRTIMEKPSVLTNRDYFISVWFRKQLVFTQIVTVNLSFYNKVFMRQAWVNSLMDDKDKGSLIKDADSLRIEDFTGDWNYDEDCAYTLDNKKVWVLIQGFLSNEIRYWSEINRDTQKDMDNKDNQNGHYSERDSEPETEIDTKKTKKTKKTKSKTKSTKKTKNTKKHKDNPNDDYSEKYRGPETAIDTKKDRNRETDIDNMDNPNVDSSERDSEPGTYIDTKKGRDRETDIYTEKERDPESNTNRDPERDSGDTENEKDLERNIDLETDSDYDWSCDINYDINYDKLQQDSYFLEPPDHSHSDYDWSCDINYDINYDKLQQDSYFLEPETKTDRDKQNDDSEKDRDKQNDDSEKDRDTEKDIDTKTDMDTETDSEKVQNSSEIERITDFSHLWVACDRCYRVNYKKLFKSKMNICEHCGFHVKMSSSDRIELLIDPGTWNPMDEDMFSVDPIDWNLIYHVPVPPMDWRRIYQDMFPGMDPSKYESILEKYSSENSWEDEPSENDDYLNRLDYYQNETGLLEAVQTGTGQLNGIPVAIGIMDFEFMGGSMGSVVGEKITRLIEYATDQFLPLILVCASGGARMQEGSLSLMQMAKISSALYNYQINEKLFYVAILTSPTTGGVTASFGMLADIVIAEPGAYIAFAGKRVIEQTLNIEVPEGSQEAEFLFDKGLFNSIVSRPDLKEVLSELLDFHGFF